MKRSGYARRRPRRGRAGAPERVERRAQPRSFGAVPPPESPPNDARSGSVPAEGRSGGLCPEAERHTCNTRRRSRKGAAACARELRRVFLARWHGRHLFRGCCRPARLGIELGDHITKFRLQMLLDPFEFAETL